MSQRTETISKPRASGNLRIGDHWNAITIIALSQSNPVKAVAELVENSCHARLRLHQAAPENGRHAGIARRVRDRPVERMRRGTIDNSRPGPMLAPPRLMRVAAAAKVKAAHRPAFQSKAKDHTTT